MAVALKSNSCTKHVALLSYHVVLKGVLFMEFVCLNYSKLFLFYEGMFLFYSAFSQPFKISFRKLDLKFDCFCLHQADRSSVYGVFMFNLFQMISFDTKYWFVLYVAFDQPFQVSLRKLVFKFSCFFILYLRKIVHHLNYRI